ncbi:MAG: DUF4097 family beta strand repeat-containing protein [Fidelibacterota bacterium]
MSQQIEKLEEIFNAEANRELKVNLIMDAGEIIIKKSDSSLSGMAKFYYSKEGYEAACRYDKSFSSLHAEIKKREWLPWRKNVYREDEISKIEILLPTGVLSRLKIKNRTGDVSLDLGGLKLRELYISSWSSNVDMNFSSPNGTKLEILELNVRKGSLKINNFGNAKYELAEINLNIGTILLDLSGENIESSRLNLDLDLGTTEITIPEDIGVELYISKFLFLTNVKIPGGMRRMGTRWISINYEESTKKLMLNISSGAGGVKINFR